MARLTLPAARKAFYRVATEAGFSINDGFISRTIDDNYSFVAVFYPISKTGRILAGCDAGLLSAKHQAIGVEVTNHLVGIKARPEWRRFWFPFFTAAWAVTLRPNALNSEDLSGFSLHGRQACWYHSQDPETATIELGDLARFLREEAFSELSTFACDESFHEILAHTNLARGPNEVLEAILLYRSGHVEAARSILRCEIPKKNGFIPEVYPGILERLESLANLKGEKIVPVA